MASEKKEVGQWFVIAGWGAMALVALELIGVGVASKIGVKISGLLKPVDPASTVKK